tara:strand:- start:315 stop:1247 length:933 start_codon:yes stop_codon:yes gene_type:complete
MTKFREFYVPPGAGSNFLAKKCLWTPDEYRGEEFDPDNSTNEFYVNREKIDYGRYNRDCDGEYADPTFQLNSLLSEATANDLISETKKIIPVLLELDKHLTTLDLDEQGKTLRPRVIAAIEHLWKSDYSMMTESFGIGHSEEHGRINKHVGHLTKLTEDYFAKCRETYFNLCEEMNWDSFIISHTNPHSAISPRLKFPNNFKSLGMELEPDTNRFRSILRDIKSNKYDPMNATYGSFNCDEFSDDSVSYRKIFFENDRYEVMKMYEFFDNKAYFHKNRPQIMNDFKEYHNDNMKVIKKFAPRYHTELNHR